MTSIKWIGEYFDLHSVRGFVTTEIVKTVRGIEKDTTESLSKTFGDHMAEFVEISQAHVTDPLDGQEFIAQLYTISPEQFRLLIKRIKEEIDDAYKRGGMEKCMKSR